MENGRNANMKIKQQEITSIFDDAPVSVLAAASDGDYQPINIEEVPIEDLPDFEGCYVRIPLDIFIQTEEDATAAELELEQRFQIEARSDFFLTVQERPGRGWWAVLMRDQ
jgi:hypothetical protein